MGSILGVPAVRKPARWSAKSLRSRSCISVGPQKLLCEFLGVVMDLFPGLNSGAMVQQLRYAADLRTRRDNLDDAVQKFAAAHSLLKDGGSGLPPIMLLASTSKL